MIPSRASHHSDFHTKCQKSCFAFFQRMTWSTSPACGDFVPQIPDQPPSIILDPPLLYNDAEIADTGEFYLQSSTPPWLTGTWEYDTPWFSWRRDRRPSLTFDLVAASRVTQRRRRTALLLAMTPSTPSSWPARRRSFYRVLHPHTLTTDKWNCLKQQMSVDSYLSSCIRVIRWKRCFYVCFYSHCSYKDLHTTISTLFGTFFRTRCSHVLVLLLLSLT